MRNEALEKVGEALIGDCARRGGWLIFYTHDVTPTPSPWGCSPGLFAAALAATGGAKVIVQSELSAEKLSSILRGAMNSPEKLAKMAAAAKLAGKPEAASLLADMVEAIAGKRSIAEIKGAGA